jgi:hypothetical protein
MEQIIQNHDDMIFQILYIILIVIASTRKELKGKPWLIAFLVLGLVYSLCNMIFTDLFMSDVIDFSYYNNFFAPLFIFNIIGYCFLIPYVIIAGSETSSGTIERTDFSAEKQESLAIGGWLVLPAIGLILGPIINIVNIVIYTGLIEYVINVGFPGNLTINFLAEVGMLVFLIYAATRFFGKKANTPTVMIALLIFQLVVSGVSLAIHLYAEAEIFVDDSIEFFLRGLISAGIWIPYFIVSKRVKETFVN